MQAWKNKEFHRPSEALITQNSFFEVKAVNGWAYLEHFDFLLKAILISFVSLFKLITAQLKVFSKRDSFMNYILNQPRTFSWAADCL